jgi:hypothetical protein
LSERRPQRAINGRGQSVKSSQRCPLGLRLERSRPHADAGMRAFGRTRGAGPVFDKRTMQGTSGDRANPARTKMM